MAGQLRGIHIASGTRGPSARVPVHGSQYTGPGTWVLVGSSESRGGGGVGGLNPPSEVVGFFCLSVYENSHGPGPYLPPPPSSKNSGPETPFKEFLDPPLMLHGSQLMGPGTWVMVHGSRRKDCFVRTYIFEGLS